MNSYEILDCVCESEGNAERILLALQHGRIDEAEELAKRIYEDCGHVMRGTGYNPCL